jgi:hypothetical protein
LFGMVGCPASWLFLIASWPCKRLLLIMWQFSMVLNHHRILPADIANSPYTVTMCHLCFCFWSFVPTLKLCLMSCFWYTEVHGLLPCCLLPYRYGTNSIHV